MAIQQLSVFVQNLPGRLQGKLKALSDAGINIRAMSLADTKDFGILRLIVSDTEKACRVLSEESVASITEVVAVRMDDKTGALYDILKALADAGINLDYMYAFTATSAGGAYVVLRVDNNAQAEAALAAKGITTLSSDEISRM